MSTCMVENGQQKTVIANEIQPYMWIFVFFLSISQLFYYFCILRQQSPCECRFFVVYKKCYLCID